MAGTEKTTFAPRPGAEVIENPGTFRALVIRSPHQPGDEATVVGTPTVTGAVVHVNGHVFGAVRHPSRIPESVGPDGVTFGASPTSDHCEGSLLRSSGMKEAQQFAGSFIADLKHFGLKPVSQRRGDALRAGTESEMWTYEGESPYPLPHELQEELHAHVWETATNPNLTPNQQARELASDMLSRVDRLPNAIFNNTSMPIAGAPDALNINTNPGEKGQYVWAVQQDLFDRHLDPRDSVAVRLWDNVAQRYGYKNFTHLKNEVGNLSVWACSAAHVSIGLSHWTDRQGKNHFGSVEEAVAIADLFNSDFATLAEFMTYSTPLVYGTRPELRTSAGETFRPKDARAAMRYAMTTTYPAPFVRDAQGLRDTVTSAMIDGTADRLDRASYITAFESESGVQQEPAAHGRVRIRMAYGPMEKLADKRTGRIEFVGCGSTPDIVALVSRNAFLQLLGIYAHEALAAGQYPREFAEGTFPSMTNWDKQRELSHRYNFRGMHDPNIQTLVDEGQNFIDHMAKNYPDAITRQLVQLARYGMERLGQETEVKTLDEFLVNPRGSISDVIVSMFESGLSPVEITEAIHDYQLKQAQQIIEHNGVTNLIASI